MATGLDPDVLLVSTIARHFPDARVEDAVVDVGFGGLKIGCRLGAAYAFAGIESVQMLFTLEGAGLRGPIEMMMSGYGESRERAVVEGACQWACSFGPVLRAALSDEVHRDVTSFEIADGDRELRGYVDKMDHVLHFAASGCEDTITARARLGASPYLASRVLEREDLVLPADRVSVLYIFVGELPDRRIIEVKLDGVAQAGFEDLLAEVPAAPAPQMVALRELCVIVPD